MMRRLLNLAILAVALGAAGTAGAVVFVNPIGLPIATPVPPRFPMLAPEIDPASAMAGLTLLAGGLAVLRGRRNRKSGD
jgi:hypothetical protein